MRDRSVEYPNRYRMALVPGTTDIYEMTPVPGEVYEEGTLMSKANLLSANSETDLWGNDGDRTPNDAFSFIGKLLSEHDENIANLAATLEGKVVTGTYAGSDGAKTISLGFKPKAVIVKGNAGNYSDGSPYMGAVIALDGTAAVHNGTTVLQVTTDGFKAVYKDGSGYYPRTNRRDTTFMYIAIA